MIKEQEKDDNEAIGKLGNTIKTDEEKWEAQLKAIKQEAAAKEAQAAKDAAVKAPAPAPPKVAPADPSADAPPPTITMAQK